MCQYIYGLSYPHLRAADVKQCFLNASSAYNFQYLPLVTVVTLWACYQSLQAWGNLPNGVTENKTKIQVLTLKQNIQNVY